MALLSEFPGEILQAVFFSCQKLDFYSLCLVNKLFNHLVTPLLYGTIEWTWEVEQIPPIHRLLRTILHVPMLATYIKTVELKGHEMGSWYRRGNPPIPTNEDEIETAIAILSTLDLPDGMKSPWIRKLSEGDLDAYTALLLAHLPNLTSLSMDWNFFKEITIVGAMFRAALCTPENNNSNTGSSKPKLPVFSKLERIECSHQHGTDYGQPRNTATILAFLCLHSLHSLSARVDDISPSDKFPWPSPVPPTPQNLTSLHLSGVKESALERVLAQVPSLHKLTYRYYNDIDFAPRGGGLLHCPVLAKALSHVAGSLRSLTLHVFFEEPINDATAPRYGLSGALGPCLTAFTELEDLTVPWCLLLGMDPASAPGISTVIPDRNDGKLKEITLTDELVFHNDSEWNGTWLLKVLDGWLRNESERGLPYDVELVVRFDEVDKRESEFLGFEEMFNACRKKWDMRDRARVEGKGWGML